MEYNSIYEVRKAWLGALGESAEGADTTFEVSKRILDHYQSGPVPPPVPPTPPGIDYDGLIFHSNVDGSQIRKKSGRKPNLEISYDGTNWSAWDWSDINLDQDEEVAFRGTNGNLSEPGNVCNLIITGDVKVKGNIMGLLDGGACTSTTITGWYCFHSLFSGSSGLTDASELILPATKLNIDAYHGMFSNCTGLTSAPALPATKLESGVYAGMFSGCISLTTAPELPASGSVNDWAYNTMFNGCSNLKYIKCMATGISTSNSVKDWVKNVSPTGTFVKNASMSGWTTGVNGIPEGWTVVDA